MKFAQLLAMIGLLANTMPPMPRGRSRNSPKHCSLHPSPTWPNKHHAAQRKLRRAKRAERVAQAQATRPMKLRKHKQHYHPQRDLDGAFTVVGNNPFTPRRMWLAGISAQRGF